MLDGEGIKVRLSHTSLCGGKSPQAVRSQSGHFLFFFFLESKATEMLSDVVIVFTYDDL